jgi:hypothetical protein
MKRVWSALVGYSHEDQKFVNTQQPRRGDGRSGDGRAHARHIMHEWRQSRTAVDGMPFVRIQHADRLGTYQALESAVRKSAVHEVAHAHANTRSSVCTRNDGPLVLRRPWD